MVVAEAPILLRPAEVAELLGCSRSKAYQLIQARRIPALRVAGSVRVPRAALLAWIDQNTEGATATNPDLLILHHDQPYASDRCSSGVNVPCIPFSESASSSRPPRPRGASAAPRSAAIGLTNGRPRHERREQLTVHEGR
ncbi:MAG: helix-turn-helix domain-containing protein [Chloroflexi bacterium]|nr:helix-turn-helix domain-containing protein [Chloroflexota bacterium]